MPRHPEGDRIVTSVGSSLLTKAEDTATPEGPCEQRGRQHFVVRDSRLSRLSARCLHPRQPGHSAIAFALALPSGAARSCQDDIGLELVTASRATCGAIQPVEACTAIA